MRKNTGYSLIELVIAMAIIIIMASIALPKFISWLPNYYLRSAAEDIQSTLHFARTNAIKRYTSAVVVFSPADDSYSVILGGQTLKSGQMPPHVGIESAVFGGGPTVQFDNRGLAFGFNGSVLVKNSRGVTKEIFVDLTGNSRIQ